MGAIADRLTVAISDVDSQITAIQTKATAEVAALNRKKAVLQAAKNLITDQIETAVAGLKSAGISLD